MTGPILRDVVAERRVIVCCGPGGVGKTTAAAAIGVAAAILGRRVCVITIDPARRLADALGHGALSNEPSTIDGSWNGTLDAVALDAKRTFDELIAVHAADRDQAERILGNPLYKSLVTSLSGTQEYMATEKLHQLLDEGQYELVVVDTPPSRNALDFLDAPERISGFLDNRIMKMLLAPARTGIRAASVASEFVLRSLGRVAGKATVVDAMGFFRAFSGMEEGFRSRAQVVAGILRSPETAYILVATPRDDVLREIEFFAAEIAERGLEVSAAIVNRVHPDFGPPIPASPAERADEEWEELMRNLRDLSSIVAAESKGIDRLAAVVGSSRISVLPLAPGDIHDLSELDVLARRMLSGTVR